MEIKQATRIQTSIFNGLEKRILVWMAERQPRWVSSNLLSFIGFIGAVVIAAGFILSDKNINYLWISSLGLLINWYGDSMDGTLARVRNTQRPVFGYYLDHILDGVNESIMFIGAGVSALMHLPLALFVLLLYLLLTINVSINAHLRREFKLTYLKMGPTEFRIAIVIANTIMIFSDKVRNFIWEIEIFNHQIALTSFDCLALVLIILLLFIFAVNVVSDLRYYNRVDPPKVWKNN